MYKYTANGIFLIEDIKEHYEEQIIAPPETTPPSRPLLRAPAARTRAAAMAPGPQIIQQLDDVSGPFGLPINYDYTGGPERRMIGGGFMRDGQYIGPFNFKNGGIANFRGYGY